MNAEKRNVNALDGTLLAAARAASEAALEFVNDGPRFVADVPQTSRHLMRPTH